MYALNHNQYGFTDDKISRLKELRVIGYVSLTPAQRNIADALISEHSLCFREYLATLIRADYPNKRALAKSLGMDRGNVAMYINHPVKMSLPFIGLISRLDSHYELAFLRFHEITHYFFIGSDHAAAITRVAEERAIRALEKSRDEANRQIAEILASTKLNEDKIG